VSVGSNVRRLATSIAAIVVKAVGEVTLNSTPCACIVTVQYTYSCERFWLHTPAFAPIQFKSPKPRLTKLKCQSSHCLESTPEGTLGVGKIVLLQSVHGKSGLVTAST
jgi:hypothetical protein